MLCLDVVVVCGCVCSTNVFLWSSSWSGIRIHFYKNIYVCFVYTRGKSLVLPCIEVVYVLLALSI
jgi:hypothetical protein